MAGKKIGILTGLGALLKSTARKVSKSRAKPKSSRASVAKAQNKRRINQDIRNSQDRPRDFNIGERRRLRKEFEGAQRKAEVHKTAAADKQFKKDMEAVERPIIEIKQAARRAKSAIRKRARQRIEKSVVRKLKKIDKRKK